MREELVRAVMRERDLRLKREVAVKDLAAGMEIGYPSRWYTIVDDVRADDYSYVTRVRITKHGNPIYRRWGKDLGDLKLPLFHHGAPPEPDHYSRVSSWDG
jgi:hypothetical protein